MKDTSMHYFCSLLIGDIQERMRTDASNAQEYAFALHLISVAKAEQETCTFIGFDETSIVFDHKTLYQAMKPLLKLLVVGLFMLFSQQISAQAYATRKANQDTLPVYLTLSCYPDSSVYAVRVRTKISDTVTGFKLVYPGRKDLPKDCRITSVSAFPKRANNPANGKGTY